MPDATMKPLILLDIDGVLNPRARVASPDGSLELVLSDAKIALVNRLAVFGRIAWVSTWPAGRPPGSSLSCSWGTKRYECRCPHVP